MSELRAEAINLVENVPEKYLSEIIQYVKNFISEKEITSEKALLHLFRSICSKRDTSTTPSTHRRFLKHPCFVI